MNRDRHATFFRKNDQVVKDQPRHVLGQDRFNLLRSTVQYRNGYRNRLERLDCEIDQVLPDELIKRDGGMQNRFLLHQKGLVREPSRRDRETCPGSNCT